jgi:hypothetical protein
MMLNGGSYNGARIVADSTVQLFTRAQPARVPRAGTPAQAPTAAASTWAPRHMDTQATRARRSGSIPSRDMFVILLTNRVHAARARRPREGHQRRSRRPRRRRRPCRNRRRRRTDRHAPVLPRRLARSAGTSPSVPLAAATRASMGRALRTRSQERQQVLGIQVEVEEQLIQGEEVRRQGRFLQEALARRSLAGDTPRVLVWSTHRCRTDQENTTESAPAQEAAAPTPAAGSAAAFSEFSLEQAKLALRKVKDPRSQSQHRPTWVSSMTCASTAMTSRWTCR